MWKPSRPRTDISRPSTGGGDTKLQVVLAMHTYSHVESDLSDSLLAFGILISSVFLGIIILSA